MLTYPFLYGAGRGIRTPVGFHPNGFQDRLVMTASIRLHIGIQFVGADIHPAILLYLPLNKMSNVFKGKGVELYEMSINTPWGAVFGCRVESLRMGCKER